MGMLKLASCSLALRVHVPNNWVLGFWVVMVIVQVLGQYMIIGYLDPQGSRLSTKVQAEVSTNLNMLFQV